VRRRPGRGSKAALAQALAALTADPAGCGPDGIGPLGAVVDCVVAARRLAGWSLWVELAGLAKLVAFWEANPPLTMHDLTEHDLTEHDLTGPRLIDPRTGEFPDPLADHADPDLADRLSCLVGELQLPADVHLGDLAALFVTSEISAATGASQTATWQRLDAARALFLDDRLPRSRALLRTGLLDWTKLRTLLTGTSDLHPDVARAVEARLIPDPDLALADVDPLDVRADPASPGANLPAVTRMTNPALERALRAAVAAIDAAALTERAARARTRRSVRGYPTQDSMARLEIEAAQEAVAAVLNDLDAAVATAKAAGDSRTPDQIRTDTAITRLTRGSHGTAGTADEPADLQAEGQPAGQPEPHPDAPNIPAAFDGGTSSCSRCSQPNHSDLANATGPGLAVSLTMTLSTWLGLAEEPAVLDRYGAIPAALARQIAREAARDHPTTTTWRCIITGDDHRSVLAVADPIRTPHHDPPARLARLVNTIHPRCVFPGCPRTARRCDHDHRIPYEDDGDTCSCNIQPLCRPHHRLKSVGLITAQPIADPTAQTRAATDALVWTTASGHTYRYDAPPPVPQPPDAHDPHDRELATTRHCRRRREQNSVDPDADITRSDDRTWRTAAPARPAPSTRTPGAEPSNRERKPPEPRPSYVVRNDPPPF
jgi:hypothetical protein